MKSSNFSTRSLLGLGILLGVMATGSLGLAAQSPGAKATAKAMGLGINIGNTLENTTSWETGWGQPKITQGLIKAIAAAGYRTVRLPVAWDTYARGGKIKDDKLKRVAEVAKWIVDGGMYCVINIHWDGGWIDSSDEKKYDWETQNTFSEVARTKFVAYWTQIATYFKEWDSLLVFESFNEESDFTGTDDAYATLAEVNQLFIDTVRGTGGRNADRVLIIAGYQTDFQSTADEAYVLPVDKVDDRLMISVHYYTPSNFSLTDDTNKTAKKTWGDANDLAELDRYFGMMAGFQERTGIPVFVGEYTVTGKKASAQRVAWLKAVTLKALSLGFVPVLWDTGGDFKRTSPYTMSADMKAVFQEALPLTL